jgi:hypothetical protein
VKKHTGPFRRALVPVVRQMDDGVTFFIGQSVDCKTSSSADSFCDGLHPEVYPHKDGALATTRAPPHLSLFKRELSVVGRRCSSEFRQHN